MVAAKKAQNKHMRALHTQTETTLSRKFESAATNIAEQGEITRALTVNEQQKTLTEVRKAVADAASEYDGALSTEAERVSARIEEGNEVTRTQITEILDRNHKELRQEINGLQRGLLQLHLEIDRKTDELKEIVSKINTTSEGPDRKLLREMGNSATVVLMSLRELYKTLEVWTARSGFCNSISRLLAIGDANTVGPASQNRFRHSTWAAHRPVRERRPDYVRA